MKIKKIFFIFFLNITFINAQTYDFDYLISYASESLPTCKSESVMYVSTKNNNYYIRLKKSENIVTAILTDYQSRKNHYFIVKETMQKVEVLFDFQYDYTIDTKSFTSSNSSKYEYSLTDISPDPDLDIENLQLQVYKNPKKKKVESIFSLDVKKSDNLFSAFEHCCIHPHNFTNKDPENILVTKATETTKKGQIINYELKTLKKVEFKLIVPEESELKYKNIVSINSQPY